MPDSTSLPSFPAVLRDFNRRKSEQGTDVPRSTAPRQPLPAVNGSARPLLAPYGKVARAEQGGTRWRDVQWVDFTSDPDSGGDAAPEPEPAPVPETFEPVKMPEGGGALRHFGKQPATVSEPKAEAIPGLATRFTRLSVPRLSPVPPRWPLPVSEPLPAPAPESPPAAGPTPKPMPAPLATTPGTASGSVVLHPRVQTASAAAGATAAIPPLPSVAEIGPEVEEEETERPFPASISTHVSIASEADEPARPDRWLVALATGVERAAALRRGTQAAMGTALARGIGRSRAMLGRLRPGDAEPSPAERDTVVARAGRIVGVVSRYVAAKEHRLRVSGLAALTVVVVALVAYGGGALLTAVTGTGKSGGDAPAGHATGAGTGADNANPVVPANPPQSTAHPVQTIAVTPPATLPSDPAGCAGFYMTRAKAGDAAAQYDLGVLYARGDGLVQDYATAASWFRAAAAQGNVAAEYNLGVLYAGGLGVIGDQTAALNWYRSAADQNHPGAQFNLALAYARGIGTKQDVGAAARWYQRAAQQGLGPAMVNLAILYEQGGGVARSPVDAYAWYAAASEHGEPQAKHRADDLFQQFSDRDKASAQGLAATIGAAIDAANPPGSPENSAEIPSRPPA
jgi:hypothetical protein